MKGIGRVAGDDMGWGVSRLGWTSQAVDQPFAGGRHGPLASIEEVAAQEVPGQPQPRQNLLALGLDRWQEEIDASDVKVIWGDSSGREGFRGESLGDAEDSTSPSASPSSDGDDDG